jgi:hypothetical protein
MIFLVVLPWVVPVGVGACGRVDVQSGQGDDPQGVVGPAVAAAVEAVAGGLAGGGLDGAGAAQAARAASERSRWGCPRR